MLRAILVDDEIAAIRSLDLLLKQCCSEVNVVGTARSVDEALKVIASENPDIVFLDIEMPHGSGFDLLEKFPNLTFDIIFITAYNQYAVKAFKYSAVDYILKPVDIDELVKAVEKVRANRATRINTRARYTALFENLKSITPRKLVIPQAKSFQTIDLASVILISVKNNSVNFTLANNSIISCSGCFKDFSGILNERGFLNISTEYYVNLSKVLKVEKTGKGSAILENGMVISLDLISKDEFIEKLTEFNSQQ